MPVAGIMTDALKHRLDGAPHGKALIVDVTLKSPFGITAWIATTDRKSAPRLAAPPGSLKG